MGLTRTNRVYRVSYTDKYGNSHDAAYAIKENAINKYKEEKNNPENLGCQMRIPKRLKLKGETI